ncbi:acyltransferase [Methylobacterium variabile]|jgi:D-alanyl-lipoteichoic acid acyltransferase DltB (MBOAT superfamily)|uniref:Probable alginate O-acetylase AlgI n=1 Tax=Methylobacterium variabile TaxID=298794 RepID=A0A0J6S8A6_9HYPH|nr:MBOAT family O-acyltransferase [Methylobacterium variabile]KMO29949.1 acyltransferase [Methylobacterium variabile]
MPFNSLPFLLLFLPVALGLHALCVARRPRWRVAWLAVLSFAFYGWWDLRFVPLLAGSVALNWLAGEAWHRSGRGAVLTGAIVLDLGLLGLFKYLGFFAGLADLFTGAAPPLVSLALPLGISFFTFQHIAYLVDLRRGTAERMTLSEYAIYVAFFPRVIAGPLVRPSELVGQLRAPEPASDDRAARGVMLLTAGLAKKVFLGDGLGTFVDPVWAAAAAGGQPDFAAAAQATVGYALQLYFDFSGYTDMALGLALLFGISLPDNFRAPYRAVSIQDFWRRWHITLSSFLRDYLYIPFGGSRHGLAVQLLALLATMTLGGLWHGAGLTFVAWGAAHGVALGLHVLWRRAGLAIPDLCGFIATLAFVCLAWVLFRAPDFGTALSVYRGLAGLGGETMGGTAWFWPLAAGAAALAILGPTAREAVEAVVPRSWAAAATAAVLALVLLQVGNDANQAFIYARF